MKRILSYLIFLVYAAQAEAGIYAIDWTSNEYTCWPVGSTFSLRRGPIISGWYPCVIGVGGNAVEVSICPDPVNWPYPWDGGANITVIGGQITAEPSSPDVIWSVELGSGHGGDGPDVFVRGAGRGPGVANSPPLGNGFPQGGTPRQPVYFGSHFDLYDVCVGGTAILPATIHYRVTVTYTSP